MSGTAAHLEMTALPPERGNDAFLGMVVRAHGKFFAVQEIEGNRLVLATPRGTIKRFRQSTDIVAVGDRVWVTELEDNEGRIEEVLPRATALERPARGSSRAQQVILANPDQAMFLFAVDRPVPHRRMLDRFLILAEAKGVPALIGVNKIDLDRGVEGGVETLAHSIFGDYEASYPVLYFSAKQGIGIDRVLRALKGKLTVIAGPSGVGKSSLLNTIDPAVGRQIQQISTATGKGRHTTTMAEIFRIDHDTFVADTPGIRSLAMDGVPPEELERHFPELRSYLGSCFFADCKHISEPGCPIIEAVEAGRISRQRYESYVSLRTGAPD